MDSIISMFVTAITSCVDWLGSMMAGIPGSVQFILSGFMMFVSVRLLLKPLVGEAGSDIARRVRSKSNSKK